MEPKLEKDKDMLIKVRHNMMLSDPEVTREKLNELIGELEKVRSGHPSWNIRFEVELL